MEVNIFFEDVEVPGLDSEFFILWFHKVCEAEGKSLGCVNLIFCSDEYLLEMNREHLDHDYYTDIITFDYTDGSSVSGDLFVSWDRVQENAEQLSIDSLQELHRVSVHGLLHLLGYGDKTPDEENQMREKEDAALNLR